MKNQVKIDSGYGKDLKEGKYEAALGLLKTLSDHDFAAIFDIHYEVLSTGEGYVTASFSKTIQDWRFKH